MPTKFIFKSAIPDNFVHVFNESGVGDNEFSLCGISFDFEALDTTGTRPSHFRDPVQNTKAKITCPDCIKMIKFCKSIRL